MRHLVEEARRTVRAANLLFVVWALTIFPEMSSFAEHQGPAFHDAGAVILEAAALALSLIKDDKCYLVTFASLGRDPFPPRLLSPLQLAPASLAGGGAEDPPWTHQRLSLQPWPCLPDHFSFLQPACVGPGKGYLLIRRLKGRAGDR